MYCLFCVVFCIVYLYMCTELLPLGGYAIAVKYIISHIFFYLLCCFMYFCVVLCIVCFVSFPVLFICICVLNYCHWVATQLQLNISYHIFFYLLCCFMYFCVVLCIVCFVSFSLLFICICVLNYCHWVATQLQLNISYHIYFLSCIPI